MKEGNGKGRRLVIVGGVAAGASAAARARRLSEEAEIILLERGPDVSFANCGLPYYIGGEIERRESLAVQTPESLRALLNVDVRTRTEAIGVDRERKVVRARRLESGDVDELAYDKLLLAPGASPIRPPLPGIDLAAIHTLRNLEDMDRIHASCVHAKRAVVVGAGFIGLEMAEQLRRRGLAVTLVELQDQVLPQMDPDMTLLMERTLEREGVELILGDGIGGFEDKGNGAIEARLSSGRRIGADLVILSIGVKPDSGLAREAGLELGKRGHIRVNEFQQTSDPDIYAAGDAVEGRDWLTHDPLAVPLGGPANRQGRTVADHLFRPEKALPFPGALGTAIVRVFDAAAGLTGWTEKRLEAAGRPYRATLINEQHHAGYFPGAAPLTLKVLWDPETEKVLGAQAVGSKGVDKRLDVLATALRGGLTIEDLVHLELAYAPPFGGAKDPVNIAGFVACNDRDGLVDPVHSLDHPEAQVVDIRPPVLVERDPVEGAVNIPLPQLRSSLDRLDRSRPVITVCALGKTSYFAARILEQNGFKVRSYSGGIRARDNPFTLYKPPQG